MHLVHTDAHLDIAQRLLERVGGLHKNASSQEVFPGALAESICQIYDKLRELLGTSGFRFLLTRAIFTAQPSTKLAVGTHGQFEDPSGVPLGPGHLPAIEATLASAFDLLSDATGEILVLRLIHQAWPDFALLPPFALKPEVNR